MRELIQIEALDKGYKLTLFKADMDRIERVEMIRALKSDVLQIIDNLVTMSEKEKQ